MDISKRKIFIIGVLTICVIAVNVAVFLGITQKPKKISEEDTIVVDTVLLTENFNNIFDNKIDYQNYNINISKEDYTKDLVYTSYTNQEVIENSYEINVNIPYLNINNEVVKNINNEINSLFYNKAIEVITKKDKQTVYDVKYKAYINDNILSLVISATLKEGENAQRLIMKTYNYNLSSSSKIDINEVLQYRNISLDYAQSRIDETIKMASENANQYNELGYNKYLRNINDKMYQLENTTVYFIGENKAVYVIYPYGNQNYTSEIDLLVI